MDRLTTLVFKLHLISRLEAPFRNEGESNVGSEYRTSEAFGMITHHSGVIFAISCFRRTLDWRSRVRTNELCRKHNALHLFIQVKHLSSNGKCGINRALATRTTYRIPTCTYLQQQHVGEEKRTPRFASPNHPRPSLHFQQLGLVEQREPSHENRLDYYVRTHLGIPSSKRDVDATPSETAFAVSAVGGRLGLV